MLYFCVAELANLDPMYQYSLRWFINLFIRAIADTPQAASLDLRLAALNQQFTFFLFQNVCR
jgi:dynein heavy chain